MIIDAHAHIEGVAPEQSKKLLLRAIEQYGIDRVYVSALEGYTPTPDVVDRINAETARFIREEPRHIGGYVYISPEHEHALDVARRAIEDDGMEGIKLWVSTYCDDPHVYPIAEWAAEHGIPILIHAFYKNFDQLPNESRGSNVRNLALRYPELKILMAHLGANCYDGIPPIRDLKNVFVDFSGSIFRANDLNYTVRMIGAQRVLFGTDLPVSFVDSYGQLLEADLTEKERDMIFCSNAQRLFDRSFRIEKEAQ